MSSPGLIFKSFHVYPTASSCFQFACLNLFGIFKMYISLWVFGGVLFFFLLDMLKKNLTVHETKIIQHPVPHIVGLFQK